MALEMPVPTRNPPSTSLIHPGGPLWRIVLLYSATGDAPCLTPMKFSTTASESRRHSGAVAVDLGGRYGKYASETYFKSFAAETSGEEYLVYFNTSSHLPQNAALCKLLGAHPRRPGKRPMFRGDVVVVTSLTVHVVDAALSATYPQRTYVDFTDLKIQFADECMIRWYRSAGWSEMSFRDEKPYEEVTPQSTSPASDSRSITPVPHERYDKQRRQEKASHRDNKRKEEYALFKTVQGMDHDG
ncbi:hypothetical protein C8R44DRAFT_368787 [Mycena epipterygia]|nr:hypothetical protein C8R44DRAFT_368787 [Mycena epipterygia]